MKPAIKPTFSFGLLALFSVLLLLSFACERDGTNSRTEHLAAGTDTENLYRLYEWADSLREISPDSSIQIIKAMLASGVCDSALLGKCYKRLGSGYWVVGSQDSAFSYSLKSYEIAQAMQDSVLMADLLYNFALMETQRGNYRRSVNYVDQALPLCRAINLMDRYAQLLGVKGGDYEFMGELDSAMRYYKEGLSINQKYDFQSTIHESYVCLATLNYKMKKYREAEGYFLKAIKRQKQFDRKVQLSAAYSNISALYHDWGKPDEALKYLELAEKISKETGYKGALLNTYNNFAVVYHASGDYSKSRHYLEKALVCSRECKNQNLEAYVLFNLGCLCHDEHDEHAASAYFDSAYTVADNYSDLNMLAQFYRQHSEVLKENKDYESALFYFEKSIAVRDSIFNIEKLEVIEDIQAKYETEKKDLEIERNELALKKHEITIYALLSIFVIAMVSLLIIHRMRLRKFNADIELFKRNRELSELRSGDKADVKQNELSEDAVLEVRKKLDRLLEDEQIYKLQDLNMPQLAKQLGTNRVYMSKLFNDTMKVSFVDYINKYRVEEAKRILEQDAQNEVGNKGSHLTILDVATRVGFKGTSSFNPTFKKHTGLTPSMYRNIAKNM